MSYAVKSSTRLIRNITSSFCILANDREGASLKCVSLKRLRQVSKLTDIPESDIEKVKNLFAGMQTEQGRRS